MKAQLVDALGRAAVRVHARLARYGRADTPGFCLITAALTAAEVRAEGYECLIQAGACYWRRTADPAEEHPMFGYAYAPDAAFSRAALRDGQMPEFHAWAAVPGAAVGKLTLGHGEHAAGVLADLSARLFPAQAEQVGKRWDHARPPALAVIDCGGDQTGADCWYRSSLEACRFVALMVRYQACKLLRQGFGECVDLLEACGGPPRPERAGGRDYLDYAERLPFPATFHGLNLVRMIQQERTGRPHVPGSTAVGE